MVLPWRVMFWRWFPNSSHNVPKIIAGLCLLGFATQYYTVALGEYNLLPGFTNEYKALFQERANDNYDQEAMRILATRRQKMIKDQEEAKEYFKANGYVPRPTNGNMVINDILGY